MALTGFRYDSRDAEHPANHPERQPGCQALQAQSTRPYTPAQPARLAHRRAPDRRPVPLRRGLALPGGDGACRLPVLAEPAGEQVCRALAPVQLSPVQLAVRSRMRAGFPGARLGSQSWPSLLRHHEQAEQAAAAWEDADVLARLGSDQVWPIVAAKPGIADEEEQVTQARLSAAVRRVMAKMKQSAEKPPIWKCAVRFLANLTLPEGAVSTPQKSRERVLMAAGAVQACVHVLREGPDEAKQCAAGMLGNLAQSEEHRSAVVAAGAAQACVHVLREGPDNAKPNVAGTLGNLVVSEEHSSAVVAAGAVQACVHVLREGPDEAKQCAAGTLGSLAVSKEHRSAVVAAGAAQAYVQVLREGPDNAKRNVARALSNLAVSEEHRSAVVAAGAVQACVHVLREGPDEAKRSAAGTVSFLAQSKEHRSSLLQSGAVAACEQVLVDGPEAAKPVASFALRLLSE